MQPSARMATRDGQERVFTALLMFHVYGLMTGLVQPVFSAAGIILTTRFDAEATLDLIERERPTAFPLVPAICEAICHEIERRQLHAPISTSLRACISGASASSA